MKHTNEHGRSMVEMLGVLAIIGVLSVGGIAGYSKAMNKFKVNKTMDQVSSIIANIRTMFSSQKGYQGLTAERAVKLGVVPSDMGYEGEEEFSILYNAFGGYVVIQASDLVSSGDDKAFAVAYTGLTQEACVTLATGDWGSNEASGLVAIKTGCIQEGDPEGAITEVYNIDNIYLNDTGNKIKANSPIAQPGNKNSPTPMQVSKAVAGCSGNSDDDKHSGDGCGEEEKPYVVWKYY